MVSPAAASSHTRVIAEQQSLVPVEQNIDGDATPTMI